jgi:hypothetical protein
MNPTHEINATRDWHIILILSTVLLIACVAWSAIVYYGTLYGNPVKVIPTASHDADALHKMQQVFDARAAEKMKYETEYHFVDPSQK